MKHLGDITKICGYDVPPVDVVIGGSPCQDLSVAGKRKGFAGARSGLYMEQIRIIKELRDADKRRGRTGIAVRPRYMVWENVEGALSSPGRDRRGEDFRAALEEAIRIAEPEAPNLFVPEKGWPGAGAVCDEQGGWSLAWRVLDAQHWGVPQRRKRICMVVDFAGATAPGILFPDAPDGGCSWGADADQAVGHPGEGPGSQIPPEREGLPGDHEPGAEAGEGAAGEAAPCVGGADQAGHIADLNILDDQGGQQVNVRTDGKCPTLRAEMHGNIPGVLQEVCAGFLARQGAKASGIGFEENKAPTLRGGQADAAVVCTQVIGHTLKGKCNCDFREDSETYVVYDARGNGTLQAHNSGGYSLNCGQTIREGLVVRRLTPLECERLQGYPDGWTNIGEWIDSKGRVRKTTDSARYKALGNSIALPQWKWLCKRLCGHYERDATMASLFDGIGGFPLIWEQINGRGSCLWNSEIEEFPMAVTRYRFR